MTSSLVFEGDVQVHLYGQNALIPMYLRDQVLASIIGIEGSGLIVNDHRYETNEAVRTSSSNCYPDGFLKAFNRPAWAEIYYNPDTHGLEIDLYESSTEIHMPILWMGILENNLMPAYEVEWEILKTIDESNTAFCALVKTQPVMAIH
jgi:hypothetical protein